MKDLIDVFLPVPIQGSFSYMVPDNIDKSKLKPGSRVLVSFRNRKMIGIIQRHANSNGNDKIKYKYIKELLDETPILNKNILSLAEWASTYYHHPIGDVISYFMTPLLRRGEEASFPKIDSWSITEKGEFIALDSLNSSPKQKEAMKFFKELDNLNRITSKAYGISSSTLNTLEAKFFISKERRENIPSLSDIELKEKVMVFNEDQNMAVKKVNEGSSNQAYLIDGVTGSGKTEVYMEAISKVISEGKQALVLIPEIGLTPQTEQRFLQRFGSGVMSMHSGKNDRERLNAWLSASRGLVNIIIGTRSSVFTPFKDLGIIVVDEEHDLSYKQADRFRYSARDIAIFRANSLNIPVILASATPSLESLKNVIDKKYSLIELKNRVAGAHLPKYKAIDLRGKELNNGFSEELLDQMLLELNHENQVLVFINRRGYAPAMICEFCGLVILCPNCDSSMTIHSQPLRMQCHHCEATSKIPKNCSSCNNSSFNHFGEGTQKVEEFLKNKFPTFPIKRIDGDTTRNKDSMEGYLSDIKTGKPMVLVGTQILAKGHHLPGVTLVGILDADSGLFSADFRGSERVAQLITQVAGRAGREEKEGKVFLQTYCPEHPQIEELISGTYKNFSDRILEERSQSKTPPFSYQARFQAESSKGILAQDFLLQLKKIIKIKELRIVGPIPSILEKKAGVYRWELNIYADTRRPLHVKLREAVKHLNEQKNTSKVRWSLDVDPIGIW